MSKIYPYIPEYWEVGSVEELIHRRRRNVLLHSVLYYRFDTSIIDDNTFNAWALELARLQKAFPEASERVHYHRDAFRDFSGETGYHLPMDDRRVMNSAYRAMRRNV